MKKSAMKQRWPLQVSYVHDIYLVCSLKPAQKVMSICSQQIWRSTVFYSARETERTF